MGRNIATDERFMTYFLGLNDHRTDRKKTYYEKQPEPQPILMEVQLVRLEITPAKLVIPKSGPLEINFKNPSRFLIETKYKFDSFYFKLDLKNKERAISSAAHRSNTVNSVAGSFLLFPYETVVFTIEYVFESDLSENFGYKGDDPEGFFDVQFFCVDDMAKIENANHYFPLILEEKTEQLKKWEDFLLKSRKDEQRRKRWGHYTSSDGFVWKLDEFNEYIHLPDVVKCSNDDKIGEWIWKQIEFEKRLQDDIPSNLEDIDTMTSEEIRKEKKRRRDLILAEYAVCKAEWKEKKREELKEEKEVEERRMKEACMKEWHEEKEANAKIHLWKKEKMREEKMKKRLKRVQGNEIEQEKKLEEEKRAAENLKSSEQKETSKIKNPEESKTPKSLQNPSEVKKPEEPKPLKSLQNPSEVKKPEEEKPSKSYKNLPEAKNAEEPSKSLQNPSNVKNQEEPKSTGKVEIKEKNKTGVVGKKQKKNKKKCVVM